MILAMTSTIIPIINETLKAINFIAFIYYIKESKCNCLLLLWANSDRMIEAGLHLNCQLLHGAQENTIFCCSLVFVKKSSAVNIELEEISFLLESYWSKIDFLLD